jgi:Flp pilus assembly protein CpaB
MQRRSTTIFIIGLLTLVLGAATTFAALHGSQAAADTAGSAKGKGGAGGAAVPGQPTAFTIPAGKQALAVALDPVAGTAGTASAGSHINVFAAVTDKRPEGETHVARLVTQDVPVLSVAAPATGGSSTFVLAVTPAQAELLVFHASFSKLWFTVLPAGAKPGPDTPGVSTATQLNPVAAG